ncbi:aldolase catalytic domain-containing protein [Massilia niastensis]|uniref:aldolase catalytic domain-containing protein n=1 Tax=Massilia niastensis TaxID=544911 RepID=UPI000364A002|nr:aldolase catalytic domain-containing protein [Massilia niastensis]
MSDIKLIDCTLRDGGYYNNWDFSQDLIRDYLRAMAAAAVDYVELGFRSFETSNGFRGACAYTTDSFIRSLDIPAGMKIGVMMNAAELVNHPAGPVDAAKLLFVPAAESPVTLVRFACHFHEIEKTLPVCAWLKSVGYTVGINLMQIADRTEAEIEQLALLANDYPLDALYFADSLGSMDPAQTAYIVRTLRRHWKGALGIHTHDNMGKAIANTLRAIEEGVTWVDSTVTGMGRGPGNAQTEYVVIELEKLRGTKVNMSPLLALIREHFGPMKAHYGWGANPYYYIAGQYGLHPTYIQEMQSDPRYGEAEILSVIEYLRTVGGKKFSAKVMDAGRQLYGGELDGTWAPAEDIQSRDVLIIGAGPGVAAHRAALERVAREKNLFVIALNTQTGIDADLIDVRAACHPFRLLADREVYRTLPQPVVVPASRLTDLLGDAPFAPNQRDFGMSVKPGVFEFHERFAVVPSSLVVAYALALATSGKASRILLAGFDGYAADDPRMAEVEELLAAYQKSSGALPLLSVTPTRFKISSTSVYAL